MTAVIIDGKSVAAKLRGQLQLDVSVFRARKGTPPGLAVVLVGNNPASDVYVRNKIKFSKEIGMDSFERRLPEEITQDQLIEEIQALNQDPLVHGILVQLPLPKHIKEEPVINTVDPKKDVDGFQAINVGKLSLGFNDALVPCTPQGCILLIKEVMPNMSGKHAVVIGRSNIVGKPMAQLLLKENCTVTIAHSKTENLPAIVKQADIVVAAVGQAEMVKADWLKEGCVVIDVGMNRITNADGSTKLVGDVAFKECAEVAAAITPVPGGVGPMTIACLLKNTLKAAAAAG